ncbi:MAG: hypothetical protein H0V76_03535 [Blastocatellia bacterium]|nr:hypothetical protein [Blastocatellia bacterium]
MFEIAAFYKFMPMGTVDELEEFRASVREAMQVFDIRGTVILAEEGFNATVSGKPEDMASFMIRAEALFGIEVEAKLSRHEHVPFRRVDVKIKPEIVTFKHPVDTKKGKGTHVDAREWNSLLDDPSVLVLDTRNDYEFKNGTFAGAVNPETEKFSDLPEFIASKLDPEVHQKVAMFCTGGIRCEKAAPYLIEQGFREVYQLDGGILRYLEEIPETESKFQGECFVFDDRITVDEKLEKGRGPDHSINKSGASN